MKRLVLAIAVGAVLALAGCGDSSTEPTIAERSSLEPTATESTAAEPTVAESTKPKPTARVVEGVEPEIEVPNGPPPKKLIIKNLVKGHGAVAKAKDEITVQYVALRWNGEPFQSAWGSNGEFDPFTFKLDAHQVIPGWERGIPGMRVGGRRELVIPPKFVYYPGTYPNLKLAPEESLVYIVDLLKVH